MLWNSVKTQLPYYPRIKVSFIIVCLFPSSFLLHQLSSHFPFCFSLFLLYPVPTPSTQTSGVKFATLFNEGKDEIQITRVYLQIFKLIWKKLILYFFFFYFKALIFWNLSWSRGRFTISNFEEKQNDASISIVVLSNFFNKKVDFGANFGWKK